MNVKINWKAIGAEFNISSQAAYMRYSRLKAAVEREHSVKNEDGSQPASPLPKTPTKATPRKKTPASAKKSAESGEDIEVERSGFPKKRKVETQKEVKQEQEYESDPSDQDY